MKRISIFVAVFMMVGVAEAGPFKAFKFNKKHFKGIYLCSGSGYDPAGEYTWTGLIGADGKGRIEGGSILMEEYGWTHEEETRGNYWVSKDGILTTNLYGGLEIVGTLVMKGKGVLVTVWFYDYWFSGQCWRQK